MTFKATHLLCKVSKKIPSPLPQIVKRIVVDLLMQLGLRHTLSLQDRYGASGLAIL